MYDMRVESIKVNVQEGLKGPRGCLEKIARNHKHRAGWYQIRGVRKRISKSQIEMRKRKGKKEMKMYLSWG